MSQILPETGLLSLSLKADYYNFHKRFSLGNSGMSTLNPHAVAQLVEALRYKSEGRGFDSRWCHWNFSLA